MHFMMKNLLHIGIGGHVILSSHDYFATNTKAKNVKGYIALLLQRQIICNGSFVTLKNSYSVLRYRY
jgi:hypothetical protein